MKRYGHPIFYPLELVPKDDGEVVLYTDHAAEVEKLEGELVEQARLLGMGGEREAKLMADVARLQERVRVLEEAFRTSVYDSMPEGFTDQQAEEKIQRIMRACSQNLGIPIQAALAQPQPCQPCQTCGGKGYETHALGWMPCPDCKPQQKEGE